MAWDWRKPDMEDPPAERVEIYDSQGRLIYRAGPPPDKQPAGPRAPLVSYVVLGLCLLSFMLFNLGVGDIPLLLVFSPQQGLVFPGLLTHMLVHADAGHLLANMLVLFFLGTVVEQGYGWAKYLVLFLVSGLLAALAQSLVSPGLLLGASGALAGVMAAFVRHFPHARLYLYFILPIPAWVAAILWLAYNLLGELSSPRMGIAFTAHIVGFVAGWVLSLLLVPPRQPLSAR